jgi:hypothetical protein
MHRYRIVSQTSLNLSILNLVLAAPIVMVQEIHEARGGDDETVVAEDVATMPKKSPELEAASDGSTSSGYSAPYLSSDSSDSGYSWLLDNGQAAASESEPSSVSA